MSEIKNVDNYCAKMKQSVYDKAFFIDKLYEPVDFILDYGCADASLMKFLDFIYPNCKYIGYDKSSAMLTKAETNFPKADYYRFWEDILVAPKHALLNLSSVIHEIYSYSPKDKIEEFWSRVFNSNFKYIAIRDMAISQPSCGETDIVDSIQLNAVIGKRVKEFERVWGAITERKNYIHFLLKYKYTENWDRELYENYLPLTVEEMLAMIPNNYEIIYFEHRPLTYTAAQIKKDIGVTLKDPTHIKLLLKLKEKA